MGTDAWRRWAGVVLLAALVVGCVSEPASDIGALPQCGPPPSPAPDPVPTGALLPPGARVTAVQSTRPPVVQLNAYVMATPDEILAFVESQEAIERGAGDSTERELLFTTDDHRVYLRAKAVCTTASRVVQVFAPIDSDAAIPSPQISSGSPGSE